LPYKLLTRINYENKSLQESFQNKEAKKLFTDNKFKEKIILQKTALASTILKV